MVVCDFLNRFASRGTGEARHRESVSGFEKKIGAKTKNVAVMA
jgi:hypothetical protein